MPAKYEPSPAQKLSTHLLYAGFAILLTGCSLPRGDQSMSSYSPSEWLGVFCFLGIVIFAYLLPTVIAACTKHPATIGIGLLNLLFGWSGIVWVATFIWAFVRPAKPVTVIQQAFPDPRIAASPPRLPVGSPASLPVEEELSALQRMKDRQLISEEEFASKRAKILEKI